MGQKVKGGMWCPQHGAVLAVKNTHAVRNTAGVGGALATGGLSLLLTKTERYVCPHCRGPVGRPPAPTPQPVAANTGDREVILHDHGERKIQVLKAVHTSTGLSLKETIALVDAAPTAIMTGVSSDAAMRLAAELQDAGATAEVRIVKPASPPPPEPHDPLAAGVTADLERLVALRDAGVLTEAEFVQAKSRVLGGIDARQL